MKVVKTLSVTQLLTIKPDLLSIQRIFYWLKRVLVRKGIFLKLQTAPKLIAKWFQKVSYIRQF